MPRPLRDLDPSRYQLVTIRTEMARLWMIPSRTMNRLIGGILARYQEETEIRIFAYCVLSNHMHLVVQAPNGELDIFFENVNREIARRVNRKNYRVANFWARRYDAQAILSEFDLLEAFLYVTTNAVKHGLARQARKWPGLCSYEQSIEQSDRSYEFVHYSLRDENRDFVKTEHTLKLSRLPIFSGLDNSSYRALLRSLIQKREELLQQMRASEGQGFMTIGNVLEQVPGSLPRESVRSRRPSCYTKCPKIRREYRRERKWLRYLYNIASARLRSGELDTVFPRWCFKPPLRRAPIKRPRKILDDKFQYAAEIYK